MTQAQADRMRANLEAAKSRRSEAPKRWTNLPPNSFTQDYIDEHEASYGTLSVPIVGCQYYKGVLHKGEMASEPPSLTQWGTLHRPHHADTATPKLLARSPHP